MTENTSQQDSDATAQQELFKLRFVRIFSIIQILFALIGIVVMGYLMFYYRPNLQEAYMDIVNLRSDQVQMLGIMRSMISSRIIDIILIFMTLLQVIFLIENRGRYWIYSLVATILSLIYLVPQMIVLLNQYQIN